MSWPLKPLIEIITFKGGGTPRKDNAEYWSDEIPWATVKDFKSLDLRKTVDSISKLGLAKSSANLIPKGHVIIPTRMALGKAAINSIDLSINQDLRALIPKVELDARYLLHTMLGLAPEIERNGKGATVKGITQKWLGEVKIPLPPLSEQKRIAGILDAADRLRAKRREALAQLDTLLQSTFLDLFGDPVTNPKGWEVVPLGSLGTLDRGVSKHRPRNEPALLGGQHPLIQTGEVANSKGYIRTYTSTYSDLGLKQSKMWPAGTLCITIAANIASTGILTFNACFPDSVVGFKSEEKGRIEYVQGLFWFLKKIIEASAPQVAQKNINLKILRELPVPLPPHPLQQRFAAIVEQVEAQKARMRTQLTELDTLFAALQQRAFNGEL